MYAHCKMKERRKPLYRIWLLVLWAVFTVSLTVWWLIFGLRQLEKITEAGVQSSSELVRGHRMLLFEGSTLVLSLVGGALAFYLLGLRLRKQSNAIQQFLLTFTHELKTPIASLRLQAEELGERLKDSKEKPLLERLVTDTSRLTLQLDNSLFIASIDSDRFIPEAIKFSELLEIMRGEWPGLELILKGDAILEADKRALQSILRNLFHNAVVHGKATKIEIILTAVTGSSLIRIAIADNGQGFQGDPRKAANLFTRHYSGSGSGIGLYLVCKLAKILGGKASPMPTPVGFGFSVDLPGREII